MSVSGVAELRIRLMAVVRHWEQGWDVRLFRVACIVKRKGQYWTRRAQLP